MKNALRRIRGESQKNIVKLLDQLSGKYSAWEVWQDFITMSAISIANTLGGPYAQEREKTYRERIKKYTEKEQLVFPQMFAEMVAELDSNPDQDFLGDLFMSLGMGNEWKGQFFTPYSVCKAMAGITYRNDLKEKVEQKGWVSVSDPACGAGALLIAFANKCRANHINYQTSVLFVAQDLDFLAGMMCYIQLSLLGCAGYVCIDDSIARPSTSYDDQGLLPVEGSRIWYTPMYHSDVWQWRRAACQMDLMIRSNKKVRPLMIAQVEAVPALEPIPPEAPATPPFTEGKAGQLTFF